MGATETDTDSTAVSGSVVPDSDAGTVRKVGGTLLTFQGCFYLLVVVAAALLLFLDSPLYSELWIPVVAGLLGLPPVVVGLRIFRGRYGGGVLFVGTAYSAPFFFLALAGVSVVVADDPEGYEALAAVVFSLGALVWLGSLVAAVMLLGMESVPERAPTLFRRDALRSTLWTLGWRPGVTVSLGTCLGIGVFGYLLVVSGIGYLVPESASGWAFLAPAIVAGVAPLACGAVYVAREYHLSFAAYRDLADRRRAAYRSEVDAPTGEVEAYTLVDSGNGVLFLGPDRQYRTIHALVGPERLWIVEDFALDMTTGRLRFRGDVRQFEYDESVTVTHRGSTFVLRTGEDTYQYRCRERPREVVAAVDDRLREAAGGRVTPPGR